MADVKPLKISAGQLVQFQSGDTISTTIAPGTGGTNPTATNGQQLGAGTSYTLTTTSARVVFGTTQPDVTLPSAGTYLITGIVRFQAGATAGDALRAKLYNVTTATTIGGEAAIPSRVSQDHSVPLMEVHTVAASSVIAIYARNATAARGVIASAVTYLNYVKLS